MNQRRTISDLLAVTDQLSDDDTPLIVEGMGALWGYEFTIHSIYNADNVAVVIQVSGKLSKAGQTK